MTEGNHRGLYRSIRDFLRLEAAAGIVLGVATVLALIASNSGLAHLYDLFLGLPVEVRVGELLIAKPLLLWINDGLMAIFFLLVGLEIKRELVEGELSTLGQALLPALAAAGGMAVPALIYALCNLEDPVALRGWAIPAATDIAFALGVLSMLGPRVPVALKVFLLAVAIFDDLGAILIIAAFYTADLSLVSLLLGAVTLAAMLVLNRMGVGRTAPYALLGMVTDYDCWKENEEVVDVDTIVAQLSANADTARSTVDLLVRSLPPERSPSPIDRALQSAVITREDAWDSRMRSRLNAVAGRFLGERE